MIACRDVLDRVGDAVLQVDPSGHVLYANRAAQAMFDRSAAFLVGQPATVILADPLPPSTTEGVGLGRRPDGSTFAIQFSAVASETPAGMIRTVVIRDRRSHSVSAESLRLREAALEAVADPLILTDAQATIIWVNRAFTELTGYSEDDAVGKTPGILRSGLTSPSLYKDLWAAILGGRTWTGELVNRRKDGATYMAELSVSPIPTKDGAPAYFIATQRDITARWTAVDALQEAEAKFRRLFEESPDGVLLIDMDTLLPVEFNDAACRNLGFNREEFAKLPVTRYEEPAEPSQSLSAHAAPASSGWVRFEARHRTSAGEMRHVLVSAHAVDLHGRSCLHVVHRDITRSKAVEASLRETTEYLEKLIDRASVPILAWDCDLRISRFNRAAQQLTGRAAEEAIGEDVRSLLAPSSSREALASLERTVLGEAMEGMEIPVARRDGSIRAVSWNATPITSGDGRVVGVVAQGTDFTRQKRLREQLYQAQKMEAIGRLAGGVAHDFNNILAVILSYAEMLVADLGPEDRTRGDLEEIKRAAERAAGLTRQLLAFSRKQVIAPKLIDVNGLVSDMEKMLTRLLGEDVSLTLSLGPKGGAVLMDPGQLEQVIMNLAVNARDAMPDGGALAIETGIVTLGEDDTRRVMGTPAGPYVALTVSDTGMGIDADALPHIFEPFFTTKAAGRGTGLGLSTVYGIVTQNRGTVHVASSAGAGTTFTVYLPRSSGRPSTAIARPQVRDAMESRETILLVEDDRAVREVAAQILRRAGYTVVDVEDSRKAECACDCREGPVDLLLTDVVMPGMSGREVADALSRRQARLRVLYMSGHLDDAILHHGILAQGLPFLQKPFTPETLLAKVRSVLDAAP